MAGAIRSKPLKIAMQWTTETVHLSSGSLWKLILFYVISISASASTLRDWCSEPCFSVENSQRVVNSLILSRQSQPKSIFLQESFMVRSVGTAGAGSVCRRFAKR